MDVSVRTWDLVTQKSSLEYCWDPSQVDLSEARQGVFGMVTILNYKMLCPSVCASL